MRGEEESVAVTEHSKVFAGICTPNTNGDAVIFVPQLKWESYYVLYQLTCVGGFSPLFVSKEVHGTSFEISGGNPAQKISWQLTLVPKENK